MARRWVFPLLLLGSFGSASAAGPSGQVLNPDGTGCPGVRIELALAGRSTLSDSQGRWSLEGAAVGIDAVRSQPVRPITRHLRIEGGHLQVSFAGATVSGRGGARQHLSRPNPAKAGRPVLVGTGPDTLVYSLDGRVFLRDTVLDLNTAGIVRVLDFSWNSQRIYGYLKDGRDGKVYRTVGIGTQVWMAQNLDHIVSGSWSDSNSPDSARKYGQHYFWTTALGLDDSCRAKVCSAQVLSRRMQGICPSGWHVPSDSEWNVFQNHIDGGNQNEAVLLRATSGWRQDTYYVQSLDSYGFRAVPAGDGSGTGGSMSSGYGTAWWSTKETGASIVDTRGVSFLTSGMTSYNRSKSMGLSLRCLADDLAGDAGLASMGVREGRLVPAFSPTVTDYADTVAGDVESVTVTPVASSATATVSCAVGNGDFVPGNCTASLMAGASTRLSVKVAHPGGAFAIYRVLLFRQPLPVGSPTAYPWMAGFPYGTLPDPRDGRTYRTIRIGSRTWMAENLAFRVDSSWCYENDTSKCSDFGRLYQWAAAMALDSSYNSKLWNGKVRRQGICPSGWHVPNDTEWTDLRTAAASTYRIDGKRLMAQSSWTTPLGVDALGFRALAGGSRTYLGAFANLGLKGTWISATEQFGSYMMGIGMQGTKADVTDQGFGKEGAVSLRCVMD